jgi:branched-subunit amino acid transport protein
MGLWPAVLLAGAITLALRALPVLTVGESGLSPRTTDALRHAATGAVTALVVLAVLHPAPSSGIDAAVLLAVLVAALVTWCGRGMLVAVVAGGLAYGLVSAVVTVL